MKHSLFQNAGRRILSLALGVALLLPALMLPAGANESTTTIKSAYKTLDPLTQIYVQTEKPTSDYPYYGAKHEPQGGVLYGRTAAAGDLPGGGYGLLNGTVNADESIISHYYSVEESAGEYSLQYWSYLYGKALADGEHAFLVYLNFDQEGNTCPLVTQGQYDAGLIETFQYLNTLTCPVFMRIGGEVNVWTTAAQPADFIQAYTHIGALARTYAPNVALVFSPNYSSAYRVDMDSYYPGDQWVDWIGTSLYYNPSRGNSDEMFRGEGPIYGDPMLNVQQTVNLGALHNKPIILTEGGAANITNGQDTSAFAAERMSKAYACLPMVYPSIKAIVVSDYNPPENCLYQHYQNETIMTAVRRAVADAGVYRSSFEGAAPAYLSPVQDRMDLSDLTSGDLTFCAYTYSQQPQLATWKVDGVVVGTSSTYPYKVTVPRSMFSGGGMYTISVEFANGQQLSHPFILNPGPEQPTLWARPEVERAISLGLVPEDLQSSYTNACNRGEFAALAVRTYETIRGEITGRKYFADTSDINVQKIASIGVVEGMGDSRYEPGRNLTREQASKVLAKMAEVMEKPMPSKALDFADTAQISNWAVEYVQQSYGSGLMKGGTDNTFMPGSNYTREQSIVTMLRLYDYLAG